MTSTFLLEANKLKNIQLTLEKNELILLDHLKKNGEAHIIEFHDELENSRRKETEKLLCDFKSIIYPLKKFKELIKMDPIDIVSDLNQIKREMFTLEKNIKSLKENSQASIDKLKEEEKTLEEEIKLYEQKTLHWSKHINLSEAIYNKTNHQQEVHHDITDFITFLARNNGHLNGWTSEDHSLFLKARTRCKNLKELCSYIHAILPDISEEEVESHENWYLKYLELKRKHKNAIKNWRQTKSAVNNIKKDKEKSPDGESRVKSAYTKKKILNNDEIQEKLKQWKQEKEEKLQTEKMIKMEMMKRRTEVEERRRQKHEETKALIQNWKLERSQKEQLSQLERCEIERQQKEFKSNMANRLIKEFQSQDNIFLKKRKELCKPKTKSLNRLPVCSIIAPRDPTRLLKPTKQWIERLKSNKDDREENKANIKSVQKLGVPEWRKNLIA